VPRECQAGQGGSHVARTRQSCCASASRSVRCVVVPAAVRVYAQAMRGVGAGVSACVAVR